MSDHRYSSTLRRFASDTSGTTAIEYAIIAAGIAGVISVVVMGMGNPILPKYQAVNDGFAELQGNGE